MRENTHKVFRANKQTSMAAVFFGIAVPFIVHSFVKDEELKKTAAGRDYTNHAKGQDYL